MGLTQRPDRRHVARQNRSVNLKPPGPPSAYPQPDRRPCTATPNPHQHNRPSRWRFGVKPGEKYENEGWENIWYYGFFGSLVFGLVGYCYKPDTSIQTWALEEARRRLEAEGILEDSEKAR